MGSERTDRELLAAHLGGDESAFEELARRHAPMVLAACGRLLGGGPDAEDAAQATFLVLARKARGLAGGRGELGAWLHRAAANVARTALRARLSRTRREKEAAAMRERTLPDAQAEELWRACAPRLDAALESLPEAFRQALVLCYFEGLSQSQAAARLAVPESTVANRCARGLEKLRERLGLRGRRVGAAAFGTLLAAHAVTSGAAVPGELIGSITAAAKGAATGAPVLALAEGVLQMMFWSKVKAVVGGFVVTAALAVAAPLAVGAISGEPEKPAEVKKNEPKPGEPQAVNGLRISLAADKAEAKAGDEVKLTLTFENVSKEKLRAFWPVPRFVADQVSLAVTGPGVVQGMQARPAIAMITTEASFSELAPGAKKTLEITLSGNPPQLADWAIYLSKEGKYRVKATYAYNGGGPEEIELAPMPGGDEMHRGAAGGAGAKKPDFKPWNGTVSSQEVTVKLGGEFKEAPQRGLIRPGGRLPRPEVRPMGGGVSAPVPEELMPDRNPQPAPGRLDEE